MQDTFAPTFTSWLSTRSGEEVFALIAIVAVALMGLVAVIGTTIYHLQRNRLNDALKRDLVERGMSAEEIATVISAGPTDGQLPKRK